MIPSAMLAALSKYISIVDTETIHIKFRYPGLEMDKKLS